MSSDGWLAAVPGAPCVIGVLDSVVGDGIKVWSVETVVCHFNIVTSSTDDVIIHIE